MSIATARKLHPPVDEADYSSIVTEDDEPVDNYFSSANQRLLTEPMIDAWPGPPPGEGGGRRTFIVDANVGVFLSPYEPPLVPDAFLSVDVELARDLWAKKNRCYFCNLMGKPPDVAIEIVSNDEGNELGSKKRRYAKMGIPYYVVYDPQKILSDVVFRGFELRGQSYVRMPSVQFEGGAPGRVGFWFEPLGVGLILWRGVYAKRHETWLRWCLADGSFVPTGDERAEDERKEREAAEGRAEDERKRSERLAARLRALGVDPDDAG